MYSNNKDHILMSFIMLDLFIRTISKCSYRIDILDNISTITCGDINIHIRNGYSSTVEFLISSRSSVFTSMIYNDLYCEYKGRKLKCTDFGPWHLISLGFYLDHKKFKKNNFSIKKGLYPYLIDQKLLLKPMHFQCDAYICPLASKHNRYLKILDHEGNWQWLSYYTRDNLTTNNYLIKATIDMLKICTYYLKDWR